MSRLERRTLEYSLQQLQLSLFGPVQAGGSGEHARGQAIRSSSASAATMEGRGDSRQRIASVAFVGEHRSTDGCECPS